MNDGTTRTFIPTKSTGGSVEKARSLHDTATDLNATGIATSETVKDKIVEVKDKVIEVKDKVIEVKETLIGRGGATAEKVRRFARVHPLKTIAIAFAVGYVGMRVTRPLRWL
jgi:ElaB/YqjD/DUF883 family membrane-anchored ribosome-binding protein